MNRTLFPILILATCACADTAGSPDIFLIDCAFQTSVVGWDEALSDGTTPRERLVGLPGGAARGDGVPALDGTLEIVPEEGPPQVDRAAGAQDPPCAPQLRLPVRVVLREEQAVLAEVVAEARTDPDAVVAVSLDAAIADHARFGLEAAIASNEQVDGVYLHLEGVDAKTSGRIHTLLSGDDGEVAWQRDVTLLDFSVAP